jgi:alpha-glucosidase (family GH31 glycosyl hydrolase)
MRSLFSYLDDSSLDDPAIERFAARRATGWRQQGSAVVLEIEGVREPDRTGIAAILAGAPLNDALERAELWISVLESGALRLQMGQPADASPFALDEDALSPAPVSVTSSESEHGETTLHLASERHGGYGPDPEDLRIEITLDPLGLAVLDASGRALVTLASKPPAEGEPSGIAPFAWIRRVGESGEAPEAGAPRGATTVSLALESGERLFALGQRSGPLNLVGTTQTVDAAPDAPGTVAGRPPFLLSSRGYGLLVNSAAGLTADLGQHSPTALTVAVDEPALDVLLFPSTWPRTALSAYARLTGREALPEPAELLAGRDAISAPADVEGMRSALRTGLSYGLTTPGFWRASAGPTSDGSAAPALLTRWAQIALLSPLLGPGSADAPASTTVDSAASDVVEAYRRLRARLLPYLLHCARETAQLGLPMLRPLLLEFSWDLDALDVDDQFLLGRDLLVAPIFADSAEPVTRVVYLPAYANWYDWWTGILYEGKQWVQTTAPLNRVPLYVRAGTVIPVTDRQPAPGDASIDVTRLLLFAPRDGAIGASVEYGEDDMLGVEQERGERKARIYVEGIPSTVQDLEIVGVPTSAHLVDASAPSITLAPGDDLLPGLGGRWDSLVVKLDVGAFTAGLELGW